MNYFNEDQENHMRHMASLPPQKKCYCGWHELGSCHARCNETHPGKTFADAKENSAGSPFPVNPSPEFRRVLDNDVTVHGIWEHGLSLETCIVSLASEKEFLVKRIMELESIAPRKIVMPDGRAMVWRCPDELVPIK